MEAVVLLGHCDVVNLVGGPEALDDWASTRVVHLRNLDVGIALWSPSDAPGRKLRPGCQRVALLSLVNEAARDGLIVIVFDTPACLDGAVVHVELMVAAGPAP